MMKMDVDYAWRWLHFGWLILLGGGLLLLAALGPFQRACFADLITDRSAPAGLDVGDSFRVMFVTSGSRDGTSSDAGDYDSFVRSYAPTALTTTWRAVVSTSDPKVDARVRTGTAPGTDGSGIPIYNMQGELLAANYADLWDGSLTNAVQYEETGDSIGSALKLAKVWTGTLTGGTAVRSPYAVGDSTPVAGNALRTGGTWVDGSRQDDDSLFRVYGISDVIVVRNAPEPSSLALMFTAGLSAIHFCRRRRHRRVRREVLRDWPRGGDSGRN